MVGFSNYKYLKKHNIHSLEELVGKTVYISHPTKGIKDYVIQKVEFTLKLKEWMFWTSFSFYKVSKLGSVIFFDEEEARERELADLDKYTKEQQKAILQRNQEVKEKELKELERLLKKYLDKEGIVLPIQNCSTCVNDVEDSPSHTCDECTSLGKEDFCIEEEKE